MGSLRKSRAASGGPIGAPRVRGSRPVSALYGTLSVVLLVAALVMALIVRPPPPPSIAELGPSPQEQIEEARENQAVGSKSGDFASSAEEMKQAKASTHQDGPSQTTTPPTTSSTKQVPGTRRCYGNPPRQTEDPHSPPCVFEIFQGDNGGHTAQGVSATEIRIAWESTLGCYTEDTHSEVLPALVAHFNQRYEFYGRRIFVDAIESEKRCATRHTDPSDTQALADEIIAREPFASIVEAPLPFQGEFHRRLAANGIHSLMSMERPEFSSSELADGWTWLVAPPMDQNQRMGGDFVCRAFSGRNARHAEPGLSGERRKIAVIAGSWKTSFYPDVDPLMAKLNGCSADAEPFDVDVNSQQDVSSLMQQLKLEEYTTVIPIVAGGALAPLLRGASNYSYYPEWIQIDLSHTHEELIWGNPTLSSQASQAFGFTSDVRVRPKEETPAFWALEDGGGPSNPLQYVIVEPLYKRLLVLASGIQMAGPQLTAESFRRALWDTTWPNPNPGASPYWQQRVSLGPGDPVFFDDYAIWWWNENAPSQTPGDPSDQDGRGSFCYLNGGGRFGPGMFPGNADKRLFNEEPCR